jgi:hypothetical protein
MATILHLPDEILLRIFDFLYYVDDNFNIYGNKNDLLASRLVCKRLATIGKHLSFEHITFINDVKGYKRLLILSQSSAANSIRRLSCYFQAFDTVTTEYVDRVLGWGQLDMHKVNEMYNLQYLPRNRQQTRLQARGLDTGVINKAIPSFERLRAINIKQDFSDRYGDMFQILDPHLRGVFAYSPLGQRLFEAITSAFTDSQIGIEVLQLGHIEDNKHFEDATILQKFNRIHQPPMTSTIKGFTITRRGLYQQAFRRLTRLRIRLPVDSDYNGLSTFVQSALLLEELWLQFSYQGEQALTSDFLRPLKRSRLRILRLDLALIEDSFCLVDFLSKHATSLKIISFRELKLKIGSWETVFIEMKKLLTLSSVYIRGEFDTGEVMEIRSGNMPVEYLATKQSRTLSNAKQTITRLIYYGLHAGTFRRIGAAETGYVGLGAHTGRCNYMRGTALRKPCV